MNPVDMERAADEAAEFVRRHISQPPRFALILGTGSDQLADGIDTETVLDFETIPHFPASTATGHRGQLVLGQLAGQPIIAMQGRFHLYEGYSIDTTTLPIHMLARLGIHFLLVSNAAGGLNPQMVSGDLMLIDSHLDLMFRTSPNLSRPSPPRPSLRSDQYDRQMLEDGLACGRRHHFTVHRGVYAGMLGPNYETRAEYRLLRRMGADVAGMSTIPEVTVGTRYGMRILGISLVTNVANPDSLQPTSGDQVIAAAQAAAPKLKAVVIDAISRNA